MLRKTSMVIRIAPFTWPSVCTSAYPIACFTFGISCSLQAAEVAAAKRQPSETKTRVGRPPRAQRQSEDSLSEAVAVIEAEAAAPGDDIESIFACDDPEPAPPAAVSDTPLTQRLDTQVIAHSVQPSRVSCIRNSMDCVSGHPTVLFDSTCGDLSIDVHRLLCVYSECIQLR